MFTLKWLSKLQIFIQTEHSFANHYDLFLLYCNVVNLFFAELASVAPVLFDLREPNDRELPWAYMIFADNTLSWALIYLDRLETNLLMIKASAN